LYIKKNAAKPKVNNDLCLVIIYFFPECSGATWYDDFICYFMATIRSIFCD